MQNLGGSFILLNVSENDIVVPSVETEDKKRKIKQTIQILKRPQYNASQKNKQTAVRKCGVLNYLWKAERKSVLSFLILQVLLC